MRTKQQIRSFIEVNHHLMTIQEMADELGMPYQNVHSFCNYYGWQAVSEKERSREPLVEKTETPISPELRRGLIEIAALIAKDMTPQEKEKFAVACYGEKMRDFF